MIRKSAIAALFLGASALMAADAHATTNLLFILDSSGSMWGRVDGQTKIKTAKEALSKLISDLPEDANMGLMVYGHRRKRDCKDVATVMPIGSANEEAVTEALKKVEPLGRTPLAYALGQSAAEFSGREKDNNYVVLISDGIESCHGDPCAAAAKLAAANINVKVHVVGFDVAAKDRAQLQCIADKGGGKFFAADSTKGFRKAIEEVTKVVKAPPLPPPPAAAPPPPPAPKAPPAPPKSEWKTVFEDNFDGDKLAGHWTVKNPNPDAYLVENGELTLLSDSTGDWNKQTIQNMMLLDHPLPIGDWRLTAKLRGEFGAAIRTIALGVLKDKDNYVSANLILDENGYACQNLYFSASKRTKGKASGNRMRVLCDIAKKASKDPGWVDAQGKRSRLLSKYMPHSNYMRLRKEGRSYIAEVKFGDDPKAKWIELPKLTSLRPLGDTPFIAMQKTKGGGEDLFYIDWVKIEALTTEKAAAQPKTDVARAQPPAASPTPAAPKAPVAGPLVAFEGAVGPTKPGQPSGDKAFVKFLDKNLKKIVFLDVTLNKEQVKELIDNASKLENGKTLYSFSVLNNWDNWREGGHEITIHIAPGKTLPFDSKARRLTGQFEVADYVGPHQGFFSFILKPVAGGATAKQ